MYKGKFIAYSLGNFIFDQDWSVETRYGLALRFTNAAVTLYPIHIIASQPVLTVGKERQDRLDRLAVFSDPALSDAIRRGEIPL
jgi:poly-gamma-glutamate synthesis protein (capsule biosynthesis protein)